jgi:alkylation response protein AidB-like acyl-CoA dehydrogenase
VAGMGGISLLLIDRNLPGISVRRMKTQGWWSSGTGYIVFEDVKARAPLLNRHIYITGYSLSLSRALYFERLLMRAQVPASNLIGVEGEGFKFISNSFYLRSPLPISLLSVFS